MSVVEVNDSSFESEVVKSELPVLVDFGAEWCGPCQKQLPLVEKFAADNNGKVKVCKVDTDECPKIVSQLGIRGVPTLMLFKDGKAVNSKVGLTTLADLSKFVFEK